MAGSSRLMFRRTCCDLPANSCNLNSTKPSAICRANLPDIPFENAFDGIVSTACFHWVLDHDRLFRNLHRAVRPGGWLQAQCGGGTNIAQLRERMASLAASLPFAPYLADFPSPWFFQNAEAAADALSTCGLRRDRDQSRTGSYRHRESPALSRICENGYRANASLLSSGHRVGQKQYVRSLQTLRRPMILRSSSTTAGLIWRRRDRLDAGKNVPFVYAIKRWRRRDYFRSNTARAKTRSDSRRDAGATGLRLGEV